MSTIKTPYASTTAPHQSLHAKYHMETVRFQVAEKRHFGLKQVKICTEEDALVGSPLTDTAAQDLCVRGIKMESLSMQCRLSPVHLQEHITGDTEEHKVLPEGVRQSRAPQKQGGALLSVKLSVSTASTALSGQPPHQGHSKKKDSLVEVSAPVLEAFVRTTASGALQVVRQRSCHNFNKVSHLRFVDLTTLSPQCNTMLRESNTGALLTPQHLLCQYAHSKPAASQKRERTSTVVGEGGESSVFISKKRRVVVVDHNAEAMELVAVTLKHKKGM